MRTTIHMEGTIKRRQRVAMTRFMSAWLIGFLLLALYGSLALMAGRLHHLDHQIEVAERV